MGRHGKGPKTPRSPQQQERKIAAKKARRTAQREAVARGALPTTPRKRRVAADGISAGGDHAC
jgi:hypothetical protein